MSVSLGTVRTNIASLLTGVTAAQTYRRRQTNPQFPCFMVGWPTELDVRPSIDDDPRDITLTVWVGVLVGDDDSSDDLLSSLLESAVTALLADPTIDVQPASQFGEQQTDDNRTAIWCGLPVKVLA